MVKLEIITDETPVASQEKPVNDYSESESDDDYEYDDFNPNETLKERIVALKDIIPPQVRAKVHRSFETSQDVLFSAGAIGARGLWVLTSATLLFGIPFGLCLAADEQLNELENSLSMGGSGDNMLAAEGEKA